MQNDLPQNGSTESLAMLGRVPDMSYYDLNLAGLQGVPTPDSLARPSATPQLNAPTFTEPDMHQPQLAEGDLSEPAADVQSSLAVDPSLPALTAYERPIGLALYSAFDAQTLGPWLSTATQGLDLTNDVLAPDPLLPDLQHPDLTPQVTMPDRPADLDSSALQTMHLEKTYQQFADKTYPAIFMDQSGMNNSRSRHMDLLMGGLDAEERA